MLNHAGNAKLISDKLQASNTSVFKDIQARDSVSDLLAKGNLHKITELIKSDKQIAMAIISNPKYSAIIYEKSTGRTLGHEAAKRYLSASLHAAQNENIWVIVDGSGWSIGHEAALCRDEVARYCIDKPNLLKPKTARGVSVAKTILLKHANVLSEQEQQALGQYILEIKNDSTNNTCSDKCGEGSNKTDSNGVQAGFLGITIRTNINADSQTTPAAYKRAPLEIQVDKNGGAISHTDEAIEIETDLKLKLSENGAAYIMQMLKDDRMFSRYLVDNRIGLKIKLDDNGNTIAHFLTKINEEYATVLSLNYETASINNAFGWSICHEGVRLFNKLACAVMKSEDNRLWELCDERGRSVGSIAVRHHETLALLAIRSDFAQSLLSIENDDGVSAAHEATKWKSFSIEVLNKHDIFSMRTRKGESVAEWAVRQHKSAAIAVLHSKQRYIDKLGAIEGSRLVEVADETLRKSNLRV